MKCELCEESFNSKEWTKDEKLFDMNLIVCDNCIIRILKSRRKNLEIQLKSMDDNIKRLENK